MKTLLNTLESRSETAVIILSIFIVIVLAALSILINNIFIVAPAFMIPVLLVSWYGGNKAGLLLSVSIICLLMILKTQLHSGVDDAAFFGLIVSLLASCVIQAILITDFRKVYQVEVKAAAKDPLTGALNIRSFQVEMANEIFRSIRYQHIFSLVYIDIDNFKVVNDTRGHTEGDKLLITVAKTLSQTLRKTDFTARIGGDEFACLLPNTEMSEAKLVYNKANELLRKKMEASKWQVTFSVGIVAFDVLPDDMQEAMNIADKLMYSIKNTCKDKVAYKIWKGSA